MKKEFRTLICIFIFMIIGIMNVNAKNAVNDNIVAAYEYNDTSCITGDESTCVETDCYKKLEENSCKVGTIIKYKVNDTDTKPFYVLYGDSNTMTLLEATTTISGSWAKYEDVNGMPVGTSTNGPTQALELLDNYTKSWKNVNDITYQMGVTEFFGNAFTKCNGNGCTSNEYVWSDPRTVKARMITVQEAEYLGCKVGASNSCPKFLLNNVSKTNGIHTMNSSGSSTLFLHKYEANNLYYIQDDYLSAVKDIRAVVVVNKT